MASRIFWTSALDPTTPDPPIIGSSGNYTGNGTNSESWDITGGNGETWNLRYGWTNGTSMIEGSDVYEFSSSSSSSSSLSSSSLSSSNSSNSSNSSISSTVPLTCPGVCDTLDISNSVISLEACIANIPGDLFSSYGVTTCEDFCVVSRGGSLCTGSTYHGHFVPTLWICGCCCDV